MSPVLVLGIGNAHRNDDGAGLAVARALRERAPEGVIVRMGALDSAALLDAWDGVPLVVVVDAMSSGAAPGTLHRFAGEGAGAPLRRQGSTHGMGLAEAAALGRALGRMPGRLVIYAIEGADFSLGGRLTPAVLGAVAPAVERILQEIADA